MFHSRNGTPSSRSSPAVGSMKRGSRFTSDDLPAPDGPTSATVSPAAMVSDKSVQRARLVGAVAQRHARSSMWPSARATACVPALLGGALLDQVDAALERGQAARDRRHHVGQVPDRRHQSSASR